MRDIRRPRSIKMIIWTNHVFCIIWFLFVMSIPLWKKMELTKFNVSGLILLGVLVFFTIYRLIRELRRLRKENQHQ